MAGNSDRVICRLSGAFFFGAAAIVAAVADRIVETPKHFIRDVSAVPFLDSMAAIHGFARKARRHGMMATITGASAPMRHEVWTHGVRLPQVHFERSVEDAIAAEAPPEPVQAA
jgi:SulP family sulfate permease